jgi:hypothetical protein
LQGENCVIMKKVFTLLSLAGALMAGNGASAQSISVQHDTVSFSTGGSYEAHNDITNLTGSALTLQWRVVSSNFPTDWMANTGICDNSTCISGSGLWPAGTTYESVYPVTTAAQGFKFQTDLASSSGVSTNGTFYVRVRINNKFGTATDEAFETFIVTRSTTGVSTVKVNNEVALYPNPATSNLNVVFDPSSDVKNIAIYNIIGKQMNAFRVTGNSSASLNLENLPSGIYFARLLNGNGDVVATKKFTKQ